MFHSDRRFMGSLTIIGIIFGHVAIYNINKYPDKYNGKINDLFIN